MNHQIEFRNSLFSYVGNYTDGEPFDIRQEYLSKILEQPTEQIVTDMDWSDLAALLSSFVGTHYSSTRADELKTEHLRQLPAEKLPLTTKKGYAVVEKFLGTLLTSKTGRNCYCTITRCLAWGKEQKEIRPHLFHG